MYIIILHPSPQSYNRLLANVFLFAVSATQNKSYRIKSHFDTTDIHKPGIFLEYLIPIKTERWGLQRYIVQKCCAESNHST